MALSTKACVWGFLAEHHSTPDPRARGLAGELDIAGQVLVRMFFKVLCLYPQTGNKISVYFSLTLLFISF